MIPPPTSIGVGLYGGSGVNACDTDALIGFLTTNSAEGLAFAEIQGIDQADIPNFINGLTEGSLLLPVTATNHNFSDGKANPIPDTTLDAGTAVLLGSDGVPRVRCKCGNPLTPNANESGARDVAEARIDDVIRLSVDPIDDRSFPLGTLGDVTLRLGPGQRVAEYPTLPNDAGLTFLQHSLSIEFQSAGPVRLGNIVLPDRYPSDFLEFQGKREITVGSVEFERVSLPISGMPSPNYCYEIGNPSNILGGWSYAGDPADVLVLFNISLDGGEITGKSVSLSLAAPSIRPLLVDLDLDTFDLEDCPSRLETVTVWTWP